MRTQEEMKKDPLVIQVSWGEPFWGTYGKGEINITEIAGAAGVKKTVEYFDNIQCRVVKETYTDMSIAQARKICKFLRRYAEPALWDLIDEEFSSNEKLYKIWRAEVEKSNAVR